MTPEGNPLTYSIFTPPANGSVVLVGTDASYTPDPDFNGSDQFTFFANDGTLDSNEGTISITVNSINDPPAADNQSVFVDEDNSIVVTLTATDPEGGPLTFSIVTQPTNGSVVLNGMDATYAPGPDYNGSDNFTFKAGDGFVDSNDATITIAVNPVNDAPVADSQNPSTDEDTPIDILLTATDAEGDVLTYNIISQPIVGSVTLNGDIAAYTPPLNFFGSASFTFIASDGIDDSNTATVIVSIVPVNDPPTANGQSVVTDEDTALDITLTGSDTDANPLTYRVVTGTSSGSISLIGNIATYTPSSNYNGPDSFTFVANDGLIDSDAATVLITVNSINDLPIVGFSANPISGIAPLTVDFDASASSDPDGTILSYTWDFGDTSTGNGAITSHPYTQIGMFTVLLTVTDDEGGTAVASTFINVLVPNNPPTADNQNVSTDEDTTALITLTASDLDLDPLTYSIDSSTTLGSITLIGDEVTYTPDSNYHGLDDFTFRAYDGEEYSNIATVSITVNSVNDTPIANFTATPVSGEVPLTVVFNATGSSDVEGPIASYDWDFGDASSGSGVNPSHDYIAAGSFTVTLTVMDNDGGTDTATTVITVDPPAPVENLILNPSFEAGQDLWRFHGGGAGKFSLSSPGYSGTYAAHVSITKTGKNIQLYQSRLTLEPSTWYRLTFAARSITGRDLSVYVHKHKRPFTNYGLSNFRVDLTSSWQIFTIEFQTSGFSSTVTDARLRFWFAPYGVSGDEYWVDDVVLIKLP